MGELGSVTAGEYVWIVVVGALTVVVVLQISNVIYGYTQYIVNEDCTYDIASRTYDFLCRTYDLLCRTYNMAFELFISVVALTQLRRLSIDKQNKIITFPPSC